MDISSAVSSSFRNVRELAEITKKSDQERKALFAKRPLIKKIAFKASEIFIYISMAALPTSLVLAAIYSPGYLAVAAVAALGIVVFSLMNQSLSAYTVVESRAVTKLSDPLGLYTKNNILQASSLQIDRKYLEGLVEPTKNARVKKRQEANFKTVQNLLKLSEADLKGRINTLIVTSCLFETIQHVYHNDHQKRLAVAETASKFIDQTNYNDADKKSMRELFAKMKVASAADLAKIRSIVTTKDGLPKFDFMDWGGFNLITA